MKIKSLLLSTLMALTLVACENKPAVTEAQTPIPATIEKSNIIQQKQMVNKPPSKQAVSAKKSLPAQTEAVKTVSAPTTQTTEETLAEVANHGRAITKTQTSKARTRAQQAEYDMMQDISSDK
jgi:hypothetical protein